MKKKEDKVFGFGDDSELRLGEEDKQRIENAVDKAEDAVQNLADELFKGSGSKNDGRKQSESE